MVALAWICTHDKSHIDANIHGIVLVIKLCKLVVKPPAPMEGGGKGGIYRDSTVFATSCEVQLFLKPYFKNIV